MLESDISGVNIYDFRLIKILDSNLPCISIYTKDDTAEKTEDENNYIRNYEVILTVYMSGHDDLTIEAGEKSVDEKLDDLTEEIEDIFFHPYETLEKLVYRFNYNGSKTFPDAETSKTVLVQLMNFTARVNQDIA